MNFAQLGEETVGVMRLFVFRLVILLCLAAALLVGPIGVLQGGAYGIAWAEDDDDDDGDDDDDDGGGMVRTGADDTVAPAPRRITRQPTAPRKPAAVPSKPKVAPKAAPKIAPKPLPEFVPEIVVLGLTPDDLAILLQEGFVLLQQQSLASPLADLIRLAPPKGLTLSDARARVRLMSSGQNADFNHLYRTDQGVVTTASTARPQAEPISDCSHANCAAHDLVGWPNKTWRDANCTMPLPKIGIIDTGVNSDHDLIDGGRLEIVRLNPDEANASSAAHGTAIVSAFVGKPGSRVEGLLPEASYMIADVFSIVNGDERADAFSLIRGLDLMADRQIRIINLSLSGPDNATLAASIANLVQNRDMILLAAVGNSGPTKGVAFPAAYPGVIGVTAVDPRGRIYRAAQRGPEVDLAAPGSGLLLATSISGAKEKTGTSFAVPFATAAAALAIAADPARKGDAVRDALTATARDLGHAGHDPVFGHGVLQAADFCR